MPQRFLTPRAMSKPLEAPEYLSASSISTFQQCPLKFKYSRIDRMVEPPTEATLRGNFVHDVLELLYAAPADQRTPELAKELSRALWESTWRAQVSELITDDAALREFRWSSWWCVENLWSVEDPTKVDPAGLEYEIAVKVHDVAVKGFVDRFTNGENGLTVSDYKTGKTPHPRYSEGKFFQLYLYGVALRELGLGSTNKVQLLFLKDGQTFETTMTDADYANTTEVLVHVKKGIDERCAKGHFEPKTSRLCDWCHFKTICPAWKR